MWYGIWQVLASKHKTYIFHVNTEELRVLVGKFFFTWMRTHRKLMFQILSDMSLLFTGNTYYHWKVYCLNRTNPLGYIFLILHYGNIYGKPGFSLQFDGIISLQIMSGWFTSGIQVYGNTENTGEWSNCVRVCVWTATSVKCIFWDHCYACSTYWNKVAKETC